MSNITERARRLVVLRRRKDRISAIEKKTNIEIEKLEENLKEDFIELGVDSIKIDGGVAVGLKRDVRIKMNVPEGSTDDRTRMQIVDALVGIGRGYAITYNHNTMRTIVNDFYDDETDEFHLPEPLSDLLTVSVERKISVIGRNKKNARRNEANAQDEGES